MLLCTVYRITVCRQLSGCVGYLSFLFTYISIACSVRVRRDNKENFETHRFQTAVIYIVRVLCLCSCHCSCIDKIATLSAVVLVLINWQHVTYDITNVFKWKRMKWAWHDQNVWEMRNTFTMNMKMWCNNRCRLEYDTKMVLKWIANLSCVLNWFILESSGCLVRYPQVVFKSGISLSYLTSVRFIPILCLLSKCIPRFGSWLLSLFQMPFHCSCRTMFHISWTYSLQYLCNPLITPWNKQDTVAPSFVQKRNAH
jgi:hypothetical protein